MKKVLLSADNEIHMYSVPDEIADPFSIINNILLLIPAALLLIVGCLCIAKATKKGI